MMEKKVFFLLGQGLQNVLCICGNTLEPEMENIHPLEQLLYSMIIVLG